MATQNDHSPSFKRACLFYSSYKTPQLIFCEYVGVFVLLGHWLGVGLDGILLVIIKSSKCVFFNLLFP